MQEKDADSEGIRLVKLSPEKQREVLNRWQKERGTAACRSVSDEPLVNAVAYKLLDAAGDAFGKGERKQGVAILKLVASEYRHSQEAALARQALDQLKKQSGHER